MRTAAYVVSAVVLVSSWQAATGGTNITRGDDLPSSCLVGAIYYKTGVNAGLHACSAPNTWGLVGGSSTGEPAGIVVVWISGRPAGRRRNYERGSRTVKVLPRPTSLRTSTLPPWASVSVFTMDKPSPTPPNSRERALSTR